MASHLIKKKKPNTTNPNLYFETAESVTAPCDVSQLRSFLAELIYSGGFGLNLSVWVSSESQFLQRERGKKSFILDQKKKKRVK